MLLSLSAVVADLEAWAEACPCHSSEDLRETHGSWHRRTKALQQESRLAGDAERGVVGMRAQGEASQRVPLPGSRGRRGARAFGKVVLGGHFGVIGFDEGFGPGRVSPLSEPSPMLAFFLSSQSHCR